MITPLMHIVTCLDERYQIGSPISLTYLNESDRQLILSEGKRLASILLDESKVSMDTSDTGKEMVSVMQTVANKPMRINPFTALLMTRLKECALSYLSAMNSNATEEAVLDLSTNVTILRLEGNPKYVFGYVFNVMRLRAISYEAKIKKIAEVLNTIKNSTLETPKSSNNSAILSKLHIYSEVSYWATMLIADYVKYYGVAPDSFDESTLETIKKELKLFGLYGFVNPEQMYKEFNNSRAKRKSTVKIDDSVVEFLQQVVRSGGETLDENYN